MGALIVVGLIALVVIVFAVQGLKIIRQGETKVIERLGRYHSTLSSGINIIWPILDRPRKVYTRYVVTRMNGATQTLIRMSDVIDLREQVYDFPEQSVITKDNVTNAIEKLTQTTLRNIIGELELDETLTSRDTINSRLREVLDEATNKWGVKVNRVELQDITPPESVRRAMEQQMQAERERRAKILKAEGDKTSKILYSEGEKEAQINQAKAQKESQILMAQGEAEAKILQAKAEAEAIEKLAEAIKGTSSDPASYQIALKYIETLKEMTSGKDNKTVYIPYEATSLLGSLGGIKEILKG